MRLKNWQNVDKNLYFKNLSRICLAAAIEHSDSPKVKCPYKDDNYSCDMELLEREIKAVREVR
jgi:hypothetical protein